MTSLLLSFRPADPAAAGPFFREAGAKRGEQMKEVAP